MLCGVAAHPPPSCSSRPLQHAPTAPLAAARPTPQIPKVYTHYLATILFFFFGFKTLYDIFFNHEEVSRGLRAQQGLACTVCVPHHLMLLSAAGPCVCFDAPSPPNRCSRCSCTVIACFTV